MKWSKLAPSFVLLYFSLKFQTASPRQSLHGLCLESDVQKQGYFCLKNRVSQTVNTPVNFGPLN